VTGVPGRRPSLPGAAREALRLTAVAFRFLTRIPVPEVRAAAPGDLGRAAGAFPLVGLAVAAVGVGARAALTPLVGPGAATVAAVGAMILVTGALHEDGLADSADGLWGGWDPRQRLEIMRDSRVGTYGVVALVLAVGLRAALLLPLDLGAFARALACAHVLARAAWLPLVRLLPPAAPGHGVDLSTPGALGTPAAAAAGAVTGITLRVALGPWAALPLLVAAAALAACARVFRRRLGGYTGDTLGAAAVLVELAVLATVAALARAGHA
jgi:adenosylcobinamide-GDP ribazoletransferase